MDLFGVCDKVLAYSATKRQHFKRRDIGLDRDKEVGASLLESALHQLVTDGYLKREPSSDMYIVTPLGEEFHKSNGYAGQRQRRLTESIIDNQDRDLTRLVNNSVLSTNASIIATNDSVQQTNQSVQILNSKTESIFDFQKKTTWLTIVVACAAVVVALLDLIKEDKQIDIQPLLHKQEQMQKQIDLLRDSLKNQASMDAH